jgi:hypothetical protein
MQSTDGQVLALRHSPATRDQLVEPVSRLNTTGPEGGTLMPSWTNKDERQYEKIKESQTQRGRSLERAKEIAARTVNKHRRETGRTPNKTTQGTGKPNRSLEDRTLPELRNKATQLQIDGRSKMNKADLVEAIRQRQ